MHNFDKFATGSIIEILKTGTLVLKKFLCFKQILSRLESTETRISHQKYENGYGKERRYEPFPGDEERSKEANLMKSSKHIPKKWIEGKNEREIFYRLV